MELDELKNRVLKELRIMNSANVAKLQRAEKLGPRLKDNNISQKVKNAGNKLYIQRNLTSVQQHEILHLYNQSIANAPANSEEMAKVYTNKCALLLRMRRYKECITEAQKATEITKSISLKVKLLCREVECLTALGSSDNRRCLEKARFILMKSGNTLEDQETLNNMIKKAQTTIDGNKLDIPKNFKRKTDSQKMIEESKKIDIFSCVKLDYSQEYGKHLVAARDFEPGDIIMIEKPYRIHLDGSKGSQYCYHCLKYLWTVVPCHQCSLRMFCSEQCKNAAWDEYHEMECFVIAQMRTTLRLDLTYPLFPLIMSTFFKALKEAGSIENLKAEIETLDKNHGRCSKDFPPNTEFLSYKNVFTLTPHGLSDARIQRCADSSLFGLIGLARYTEIFGKTYKFNELKGLNKNETAVFVGAVLTKFGMIVSRGCLTRDLNDPAETDAWIKGLPDDPHPVDEAPASFRPLCKSMNLTTLLTPLSCMPAVEICCGSDLHCIMYALQPIKAGMMLSSSDKSLYHETPDSERQEIYQRWYHRRCECQACEVGGWLEIFEDGKKSAEPVPAGNRMLFKSIQEDLEFILMEWHDRHNKLNYPNSKVLSKIKSVVAEAWKIRTMPSQLVFLSVSMLIRISFYFHTPSRHF